MDKIQHNTMLGHSLWLKTQKLTFIEKEKLKRFVRKHDEPSLEPHQIMQAMFYFYALYFPLFPNYGHVLGSIDKEVILKYDERSYRIVYSKFLTQMGVEGTTPIPSDRFDSTLSSLKAVLSTDD
jgi:hypothetical protein